MIRLFFFCLNLAFTLVSPTLANPDTGEVNASHNVANIERFETRRPDDSILHWALSFPGNRGDGTFGLVVAMQGSGCDPASKNNALATIRSVFSGFVVVTADKYGVNPDAEFDSDAEYEFGEIPPCSSEYYANSTNSQRVADYRQILEGLSAAKWWNGQLIVIGGSEGGDIAARLSAQEQPDATVLISTGGGSTFGELVRASIMAEMKRHSVPSDQWPDVDEAFSHARANPDSAEIWNGSSYKYWADAIDHRSVDDMLKVEEPVLLIQGTNDQLSLPHIARAAVDKFTRAGRCNLTYWEKSGYSHGMVDPDGGDHLENILEQAQFWVQAQLEHKTSSPCMKPVTGAESP